MFNIFSTIAFAEGEAAAATSGSGSAMGNPISTILMIGLMIAVFYFLLIRPQKKKDKEKKEMLASVSVGDTIATIGLVIGKVIKVREDDVTIVSGKIGSTSEQSTLKFKKWAIGEVIKKNEKALDEPVVDEDEAKETEEE